MLNRQIHTVHSTTSAPSNSPEVMDLGENLRIHPDQLFSNGGGVFGAGVQGSGKTGIMVRLLEQAARFHIPMCIWDLEGDVLSAVSEFPRGVIGTRNNCPMARDIVGSGLQCIFDLSTWGTSMDVKGSFVSRMVNNLYATVDALPASHRMPVILGLDETALWLPQRRGEVFSVEIYKQLADAFHLIATTGRKRGLVPVMFTQKISEVNKSVLSPGTYILGRQTVHVDQKRYLDYLERREGDALCYMSDRQVGQYIASLPPGRAIVRLSTGEQRTVQFFERTSLHLSHSPTTQSCLNLYSNLPLPGQNFGADIEDLEEEPLISIEPAKISTAKKTTTTGRERVYALLEQEPNIRTCELARKANCDPALAARAKRQFFAEQQEAQP